MNAPLLFLILPFRANGLTYYISSIRTDSVLVETGIKFLADSGAAGEQDEAQDSNSQTNKFPAYFDATLNSEAFIIYSLIVSALVYQDELTDCITIVCLKQNIPCSEIKPADLAAFYYFNLSFLNNTPFNHLKNRGLLDNKFLSELSSEREHNIFCIALLLVAKVNAMQISLEGLSFNDRNPRLFSAFKLLILCCQDKGDFNEHSRSPKQII